MHGSLNNAADGPWCLVTMQGTYLGQPVGSLQSNWASLWQPYYQELVLVSTSGAAKRRLCHLRSRHMGASNYWWMSRAALSWDGVYAVFGSNFGVAPVDDYTDVYLVQLRDLPPTRAQPVMSSVTAGTPGPTQVVITWTTDRECTSQVEYGPTTFYAEGISTFQPALNTSHSVTLTALTPSTLYHFRAKSRDQWGNWRLSADGTFTTAAS
jgi:hypothetical protein